MAAASSASSAACATLHAIARYMPPVSTRRYPSREASRRATVLLPAPAGPSIVTTGSRDRPIISPLDHERVATGQQIDGLREAGKRRLDARHVINQCLTIRDESGDR